MAKSLNRIRFRCENCQTGLEARRSQIGEKIRCPYCHQAQKVPPESVSENLPEGYALLSPDAPADGEPYVSIACTLCGTRLHGKRSEIGKPLTCPDCGAVTVLKPPQTPSPMQPATPQTSIGQYDVCAGEGQPKGDDPIVYRRYIPVICGLCRTRLLATEEEAGGHLVCPDCGTDNRVPDVTEDRVVEKASSPGEYDVAGATGTAPSKRYDDLFAMRCPRCQTRLHARRREAGSVTTCPDCSTRFTVPRPPKAIEPEREDPADVYGVHGAPASAVASASSAPPGQSRAVAAASAASDAAPAPPPVQQAPRSATARRSQMPAASDSSSPAAPPPTDAVSQDSTEAMRARIRAQRQKRRRERLDAAPRFPFLQGVWGFPFSRGVWTFWLFSGGGLFLILQMLFEGGTLIVGENPLTRFVGVLIAAFAGVLGVMGLVAVAGYWLAILGDTSEGCATIEDWPELVLIDWSLGFLHLIVAGACAVGIGTVLTHVFEPLGVSPGLVLAASIHLLFPLVLLSTLETELPFQPVSLPILRSLGNSFLSWTAFYVAAAALWPVLYAAGEFCVRWPGMRTIAPASFVLAAVAIVYFRLLGRLAMVCENRARRADLDAEEAEDAA